jgi:hypothetical protein
MRSKPALLIIGVLIGALVNILLNLIAAAIQQRAIGEQFTDRALWWLIGFSVAGLVLGYFISTRIESTQTSPREEPKPDSDNFSKTTGTKQLKSNSFDPLDKIFENTALQTANAGASSGFLFETKNFASKEVLNDLRKYNNRGLFAVDRGIALYLAPGFNSLKPEDIKIKIYSDDTFPHTMKDPTKAQLLKFGVRGGNKKIQSYLRERTAFRAQGEFRTKVGLYRLDKPNPRIGQGLTLHIIPLSYWTIREFNRRLLESSDNRLQLLKEESLQEILSPKETIIFPCPSALYVEVTLVTNDKKLVVLEKSSTLSALATRGMRWTCTIEEGLEWSQIMQKDKIDLNSAILRGIGIELGIGSNQVLSTEFHAIALEHTHLNTAILGTIVLDISSEDLLPKIAQSEDFGRGYNFVSIDSALQKIFFNISDEDRYSWHPTGRMRALFALYTALGPQKVIRKLKSALS